MHRTRWAKDVEALGHFPGLPLSLMGESPSPPPKDHEETFAAFREFYQLWGLASFATWDLPIPMQAELLKPTLYDVSSISLAGGTFFVPWYVMRANNLEMRDLMRSRLTTSPPKHLLGWIDGSDAPKKFGVKRYAAMMRLISMSSLP